MSSPSRSAPSVDEAGALVGAAIDAGDPDHDILQMVETGKLGDALRALMKRHGTAVCRYCREELHDPALADDVQQHIFIQVHRDLGRFSGRSTLRTWLFAIARHRVLDAAKARARARAHLEEDETADTFDPSADPGDRIDDARLGHALVTCIRKLSPQTRTALLLRHQQGFTFEEMSEICHEKPGTLQARVMRALPALRRCIEARTGGNV